MSGSFEPVSLASVSFPFSFSPEPNSGSFLRVGLAVSGSEQLIFLEAYTLEKSLANFASILYCEYLHCHVFALCLANFSSYISVSG